LAPRDMKLTKRRVALVFLVLGICGLSAYVGRPLYLPHLGEFLVHADPLEKADAIVILAGDDTAGSRVLEAVSLLRGGWAEVLMVSDAPIAWGVTAGELARKQAVELGVPPRQIIEVSSHSPAGRGQLLDSTLSESQLLLAEWQKRKYKTVIVVTSNFHTRRARRIFQRLSKDAGIRVLLHPSTDTSFHVDRWWTRRADARMWLLEMQKLAFSYFELP
jgi:uncharacterized SAM-binding protein YcdF (DUF218 family)